MFKSVCSLLFVALITSVIILSLKKVSIFDYYDISNKEISELTKLSKSQVMQDIFVYLESGKKKKGFFVEFGATNGISISNTYMLENHFGWKGILVEPGLIWHEELYKNRPNAKIDISCVWKEDGSKITFNETKIPVYATIDAYSSSDTNNRTNGKKYEVETITLLSLLDKHNAPEVIDYLSIDTEGSELDILKAFFNTNLKYKIKIITCEHNFTKNREEIYNLLVQHGYERKYTDISEHDDFYVLKGTGN